MLKPPGQNSAQATTRPGTAPAQGGKAVEKQPAAEAAQPSTQQPGVQAQAAQPASNGEQQPSQPGDEIGAQRLQDKLQGLLAEAQGALDDEKQPASVAPQSDGEEAKVGRVVSVSGSQVITLLKKADGVNHPLDGHGLEIGKLVKMRTSHSTVFGIVSGLSIPIPAQDAQEAEMRIIELELLGESMMNQNGKLLPFQRGVTTFPTLGDGVFEATQEDLSQVFACPSVQTVRIGTIHQDRTLPAQVAVDDLLGKHFALLGTTGSGKSCAVALILRALLQEHPNAHVVLLDPHNEYPRAFGDAAELIDPDTLQLPYWLFNFEEFVEVVLGRKGNPGAIEASILNELIPIAKRQFLGDADSYKFVTVDTPVPYRFNYLIQLIDDIIGKLDKPEDLGPYMRLKARLNALQQDSRFAFMFGSVAVRDNMAEIISRIFRIPVAGRPITIMDLSGVPSEILNVVVSVLCRMTFDFALWSDRALPILLVCEEAHRYAPQDPKLGFEPTKRALSRIAKEGRKYGVSLCVISQRPSELAAGILSQCNTIFALRMANQKDQEFVRSTLSESALGLMDFLPLLRTAEAIAVGEGVPVPVRICFDSVEEAHRPLSGTAPFSATWKVDAGDADFIDIVVDRWRRQQR